MNRGKSTSSIGKFRKWEKVIQPIVKYTRASSPLGYPLDFFYELQQILANGHTLRLNIATTLTGAKDNCIKTVFEGQEEIGMVTFSAAVVKSSFDAEVERQWQDRISKFCERDTQFDCFYRSLKQNNASEQILPCALIKQKSVEEGRVDYQVLTLSKDQYKKCINLQVNQIAQCFVWGSGKQTSIIRFFYFPDKQNSEAFKVDNLQGFMKRRFGKGQFKVREQTENSLTFVKIMFHNKSFYAQTLSLVDFLQKHLKIKIEKIVTDWVLDPHNRYFFIDLKELKFSRKPELARPVRSLTDALAYLTCAVCQQKFRSDQITKMLTDKLISQFFQHLRKRQIQLSFTPLHHKSTDTSRLCDLCYMLVVSQAELMELQRSVAVATHSLSIDADRPMQWQRHSECGEMYQWRLFLYLQDIRDLNLQEQCDKGFYVMMRLHNSITAFKLKDHTARYNLVKGIKVHYLFSESPKIEKFLSNSQITVRITRGQNWNAVVAEGSTSGLYQQSQKYSMRKFKQILVFDSKSRYSVIGMHIGLRLQGRYDPHDLTLMKYHDVFMVDSYSNCYSLPAEWMQTIDPSYCITKSQSSSFNYGLHLSPAEKRTLLPAVQANKKRLVL